MCISRAWGKPTDKTLSCFLNCNSQIREMIMFSTCKSQRRVWGRGLSTCILKQSIRYLQFLCSTLLPLYLTGKRQRYPFDRRLSGPQNRSGYFGDRKSLGTARNQNPIPRISSFNSRCTRNVCNGMWKQKTVASSTRLANNTETTHFQKFRHTRQMTQDTIINYLYSSVQETVCLCVLQE
jgi:hypothetical protein